jgi:hypothetical protein
MEIGKGLRSNSIGEPGRNYLGLFSLKGTEMFTLDIPLGNLGAIT